MSTTRGNAVSRGDKLHAVAVNINGRVDIPAVPEWAEQQCFDRVLTWLDSLIPDHLLDVMVSASDGISEAEADVAQSIVETHIRSRLPGIIARLAAVDLVVDRIGDTIHDLLLVGNAA